ncbi:imidazole glycerol phosphate synthase subunit HisF [Candidatus Haliotispira prima]|uniref:Imidazole glycerol phosphate synthase subunit HisF n=1 Tax=Candidatus Haliotispira prima TaxID=3034016 RepID=A0ABY8MIW7_9SPIO|nr:imidazole glycerol phosphate synthase subunit HisF [Candidatus Haliotispira prima]
MLCKRIIPCLDVKDGQVVKGVEFRNHEVQGGILELARRYCLEGADELVFYDITASSDLRSVDKSWVAGVAEVLDIPFAVAGGIRSPEQARIVLANGADKISINSPALERPDLIDEMAHTFGNQCVVVGIDSYQEQNGETGRYCVKQYTGRPDKMRDTTRELVAWAHEVQERGAGEIVLNCMNRDGKRDGYDIEQLTLLREEVSIPIVASGGAGTKEHFLELFRKVDNEAALAASVFHKRLISIPELKQYLQENGVHTRV